MDRCAGAAQCACLAPGSWVAGLVALSRRACVCVCVCVCGCLRGRFACTALPHAPSQKGGGSPALCAGVPGVVVVRVLSERLARYARGVCARPARNPLARSLAGNGEG
jgi:hypothetical protein